MDVLIKKILEFGIVPTFLLIILFLVVQEPDRALKLKALITEPFFRLFKWFSKGHISSKISANANMFLNSSIFSLLTHAERFSLKVKWVSTPEDPILQENGTLILRMKEDDDQTKNILSAVHLALPSVLCPYIRKNINTTCEKSIDLTVLQKLADKLGKHGKLTFKKYFLDPETENDRHINLLIRKLITLDNKGFFVPIFINELELMGEGLFSDHDQEDYSEQVIEFIEYLLTIVKREVHEEIQLEYFKIPFKVSTILLAKTHRADTEGLKPYLNRIRLNLDKGSDSIYIIVYPIAFSFFDRLIVAADGYDRVFVKKVIDTHFAVNDSGHTNNLKIGLLTRNDVFANEDFESKINEYKLKEGSTVSGTVDDISQNEASVNVLGMRAYIARGDCSWRSTTDCSEKLKIGGTHDFQIKKIDKGSSFIYLTLKTTENNPWYQVDIPAMGSIIEVVVISYDSIKFTCLYKNSLEVFIQTNEISWFLLTDTQKSDYIGTSQKVKVINVDENNEKIFCSLRQIDNNPWPKIHASLPIGKELNGKVCDVNSHGIQVRLPNNYYGFIPKDILIKSKDEYINYQENVVIGQGIIVIVSKVFIAKQRIRLDLKKNKN